VQRFKCLLRIMCDAVLSFRSVSVALLSCLLPEKETRNGTFSRPHNGRNKQKFITPKQTPLLTRDSYELVSILRRNCLETHEITHRRWLVLPTDSPVPL
jgi:hypothetical protein